MIYGQHIGRTSPGESNPIGDAADTTRAGRAVGVERWRYVQTQIFIVL